MAAVKASPELVKLGRDGRGNERFTSQSMLEVEQRLERAGDRLAMRHHHGLAGAGAAHMPPPDIRLGREQQAALDHILKGPDLANVIGYAGTGKSTMPSVARDAWERAGYRVQGGALSGIAAENLESGSGISSRTLASLEHRWAQGRDNLNSRDVLVIDEAGMIGSRQMARIISEAEKRGAKVVLVGDPEQLQAIEAGAAFRLIAERHGAREITEVRRQREEWQQAATRQLATGRTAEAIQAYQEQNAVYIAATREDARAELVDRWSRDREASPAASRIILAHTNNEVHTLNLAVREGMRAAGELGQDVCVQTERGDRQFAWGDRIMFLRNERSLGVKNGSLGRMESVTPSRMAVMLDDGRAVTFDTKDYAAIDHGYAATIHNTQGVTVDRTYVLATPGLDRHAAYVALSRHREGLSLHYGQDDFVDPGNLVRTLGRDRAKDMAADHGASDTPDLSVAVKRHGKIIHEMRFSHSVGEPYSAEQRTKLKASRTAVEEIRPHAPGDLEAAFASDTRLIKESASGRTQAALRAMQLESEMRTDPELRADTFVQRWQALQRQRRSLVANLETGRANRVADRMIGMAKSLERDPQVESILRQRKLTLGGVALPARNLGQTLAEMVGRTRGRGFGIGM